MEENLSLREQDMFKIRKNTYEIIDLLSQARDHLQHLEHYYANPPVRCSHDHAACGEQIKSTKEDIRNMEDILSKRKIFVRDILKIRNQEVKHSCLKFYGYENFVKDIKFDVIDKNGKDQLLIKDNIAFASVVDSSTGKRYLLRVPPIFNTVKAAVAWTFGLDESEYNPIIEA